jgi:hypothetical protein
VSSGALCVQPHNNPHKVGRNLPLLFYPIECQMVVRVAGPMDAHSQTVYQDPCQLLCLMLERLIAASMFDAVARALAYKG